MAKRPVLLTSVEATSASVFNNVEQTFCLSSNCVAKVFAIALFVIARAAGLEAAFMGAFVLGNMHSENTVKDEEN